MFQKIVFNFAIHKVVFGIMRSCKKSYKLLLTLLLFVFGLLLSNGSGGDRLFCYDFSTCGGTVLSCIHASSNTNSFSEWDRNTKTDCVLAINESRFSFFNDNGLFGVSDGEFCTHHSSQALISYIHNYSCNRVLHPLLEQLGVLLI